MHELSESVSKFLKLLQNLERNVKNVAEQYVRYYDLPGHGQEFKRQLIRSGIDGWLLDMLYEVGLGRATSRMCFIDREKSQILLRLNVTEQERIIDSGIGRKPFSNVAADELRAFVEKVPPRKKPPRPKPTKKIPKWVLRSRGIHFNQSDISWIEFSELICQATNAGYKF